MGVDHVNGRARKRQFAQLRPQHGVQVTGRRLEAGWREGAGKLGQHQRMRR